jgi:predicted transcriptional regulator
MRRVDLAYVRLASSEIARDINRDVVLEVIRANQPVSRAELSRLSGLQPSTISLIVNQLIEERWVREGATTRLPRGRRPTMVGLNDDLVMLVADIRPKLATVAIVDLNGRFLSRAQLPVTSDPEKTIARIVESMLRMKANHAQRSFEGVGIALPGRVDSATQRLRFAPNLGWPDFDIKGTIEKGTGMAVEMDNAANACLLAETWFGRMDGVRNAVLVTISEGVGTGILSNGQIIYGDHNMAGEFGHVPLDINGPVLGGVRLLAGRAEVLCREQAEGSGADHRRPAAAGGRRRCSRHCRTDQAGRVRRQGPAADLGNACPGGDSDRGGHRGGMGETGPDYREGVCGICPGGRAAEAGPNP